MSNAQPRWMKIKQATKYAGLSRNSLMRLIEAEQIRARKRPVGGWVVDRASIDEYNAGSGEEDALFNDLARRAGLC